ncbi:MAG: methionine adenosyltransferase [Bdellovibrionales bacterium]|nr:methionine adenosyltransferase [Bdellovibrionales bacterium]
MKSGFFTSESVSEGHPDKMADQISDALLDAFLKQDPYSRVACEIMLTRGLVVVGGEVTTGGYVDIQKEVREVIRQIGYDHGDKGFDYKSCSVLTAIDSQSQDIALGLGKGDSQGAGDQGLVFGYAVDETEEYMPLSISLAHKLMKTLCEQRKTGERYIWPDSKSQVTVEYREGEVTHIPSVVISTQHAPSVKIEDLREFIIEELIKKVIPKKFLKKHHNFYINPTGRFVIGGPSGDCGLTGRKIIVDTYGGHGAHGGGAFSGKDPSKVDRSGAYVARHIAKNIVAAGLARRCLIQIAYAIGVADPVSLLIQTYGTSKVPEDKLTKVVEQLWDLRPAMVIKEFDLLKPVYSRTAAYGHFGKNESGFTWENLNKVESLQAEFSL